MNYLERISALERRIEQLERLLPVGNDPLSVAMKIVSRHFNVTPERISSGCREQGLVRARWVCIWILRVHFGFSLHQIARTMNRHHTAVVFALNHIDQVRDEKVSGPLMKACEAEVGGHSTFNIQHSNSKKI